MFKQRTDLVCGILLIHASVGLAQGSNDLAAMTGTGEAGTGATAEQEAITVYDPLVALIGGDSVRACGAYPCIGWVEDTWPDGRLKHRGYYDSGHLILYKNYHANGELEREFKQIDARRCQLRTWFANGSPASEVLYIDGVPVKYTDHYPSGAVRYTEEKHRTEPIYITMDLFSENGVPVSTLHLVDKKRVIFEQCEYHSNGRLHVSGRAQYDPGSMDSKRIGTWTTWDETGRPILEERYVEGRLSESRTL